MASTSPVRGPLVTWDDARGFGFIRPESGGPDVFVHARDLTSRTLVPSVGDVLGFDLAEQPDGRWRATRVAPVEGEAPGRVRTTARQAPAGATAGSPAGGPHPGGRAGRGAPRTRRHVRPGPWAVLLLGAAGGVVVDRIWGVPVWLLWWYLAASVVCALTYASDKAAARAGRWRTPEGTLLLLGLVGGWPGAVVAQETLRHKTVKAAFRGPFWGTVVVNVAVTTALCSPWGADVLSQLVSAI